MRVCDNCEKKKELEDWGDSELCNECLDEVSFLCEDCESRVDSDDGNSVNGEKTVCNSCFDEYVECGAPKCDTLFSHKEWILKTGEDATLFCSEECFNEAKERLEAEPVEKKEETMSASASGEVDWARLATAVSEHAPRVLLHGPPGTGKTYLAVKSAADGQAAYSVTLDEDMSPAQLIGHWKPGPEGKFVWHDGPAIKAWREGALLVVNEVQKASAAMTSKLHAVLDDPDIAMLTLDSGETVKPTPGFRCIGTMNGNPDDLPEALRDRFPVRIEAWTPTKAALAKLPPNLRKQVQNSYASLRAKGDQAQFVSYRQVATFVQLQKIVGAETAAQSIFGPRWEEFVTALKLGASDADA